MAKLLTRDEFREGVQTRDRYMCVWCCARADLGTKLDSHHIIERRLFADGGYFLDNGVSVCEPCHLQAEQTLISCEELRERAGITEVVLPEHLYRDQKYTKWGDPILDNGMRLKGELFEDESVQKVLKPVLHLYTNRVKYPRTYHVPSSPGATDDDRKVESLEAMFAGHEVVVTEKLDGENCTLYSDYIHARSLEYAPHPSRDRVKAMWSQVAHDIPPGWRVCAENLFALHSIPYDNLKSYLYVFSVWSDKNICLPWDETVEWATLLGFPVVPVLGRGLWNSPTYEWRKFDESWCHSLWCSGGGFQVQSADEDPLSEGYVVRLADSFHYKDFRRSVAKYVRKDHVVHRDGHWTNRPVVPNKVRK